MNPPIRETLWPRGFSPRGATIADRHPLQEKFDLSSLAAYSHPGRFASRWGFAGLRSDIFSSPREGEATVEPVRTFAWETTAHQLEGPRRNCYRPMGFARIAPIGYRIAVILIIDNYDSFTYNLVQTIGSLPGSWEMKVVRNDAATVDELAAMKPTHVILSPGPCTPNEAGVSVELILRLAGKVPILGVCLGHQCIGQAFGGQVVRAPRLMHGKTSPIKHDGCGVYKEISNPFTATRYHSLTLDRATLPEEFAVTAWTDDRDELMGIRHKTMPIEGVQFHPESFLTEHGSRLLENFLGM